MYKGKGVARHAARIKEGRSGTQHSRLKNRMIRPDLVISSTLPASKPRNNESAHTKKSSQVEP